MKFFLLLLHIEKENYFNLSPVYISQLCCKEEYVRLFGLYGDIQYNIDKRENVASYWNREREEEKNLVAYATFCFLWRHVRQYRK